MPMKMGGWVVGAALLSSSAPLVAAGANAATALEPSTRWNVHYADDFCRLTRDFGVGDSRITVVIDQFGPGDEFRLTLAGKPMKRRAAAGEAAIRFGSSFSEQRLRFYSGTIGKDLPAWIFATGVGFRPMPPGDKRTVGDVLSAIAPLTDAEKASVTTIDIGSPLRHSVRLQTGSMQPVFAAMERCTDELLTHWGIDVARHKTLSRPVIPEGNPGRWLTSFDYPQDMLRKRMPGIVEFRLTVGEDGRATACHIQQSTDSEGFDATVCGELMRHARFKPALDKDGKPMISYYRSTVRFRMP